MGIFSKLFGSKRPTLKKQDIPKFEKVAEFVFWFIRNEPFVQPITSPSNNIIFSEGYRPKAGTQNNPESLNPNISSLPEWFVTRVYIDLNILRDASKDEFRQFIDLLDEAGNETLADVGKIYKKYNLDIETLGYEKEIEKIPAGTEREMFKVNWLDDNILGAEIRILAWLYHEYFGDWYQLKEKREREVGYGSEID